MADKGEIPKPTSIGAEQRSVPPRPPLGRDGSVFRHAGQALALAGVHRDSPEAQSLRQSYGLTNARDTEVATNLFYESDGKPLGIERVELLGEALARLGDKGIKIEDLPGRAVMDLVYRQAEIIEAEKAARSSLGEARQMPVTLEPIISPRGEALIVPNASADVDISAPRDNFSAAQLRGLTSNDLFELTGSRDFELHNKVRSVKSLEELEEMGIDLSQLDSLIQRAEQRYKDILKRK
jgi:hypothetical protein